MQQTSRRRVGKPRLPQLERLFTIQIQTLSVKNYPDFIIEMLANQRALVLETALNISNVITRLPFLPVIPYDYGSVYDQMLKVRNGNYSGSTVLQARVITDLVRTPNDPYYVFDVEDGASNLGRSPYKALALMHDEGRLALTVPELIALCIHTEVLSQHFVDAIASRYEADKIPDIWLERGRPRLGWAPLNRVHPLWGAPSCAYRDL